jgi:OmpA-OmpF porin, OOP family
MMDNLSDVERPLVSGELKDNVARFVGARPESASKAFEAALPAAMYAIAEHGSSESGARGIIEGLKSGQIPELDPRDVGPTLEDPRARERLTAVGLDFAERLFGKRHGAVLAAIGDTGGLNREGAGRLLALAGPLAMGIVGKRVRSEKLDAAGLARFLSDQKAKVGASLPDTLRPVADQPERAYREQAVAPPAHKRRLWPWVVASLAALAGLGLLGRALLRSRAPEPAVAEPAAAEPVAPAPVAPTPVAPTPVAPAPALTSSSIAVRELASSLGSNEALPRRWTLDGVSFAPGETVPSGDATLVQNDLVSLMRAYPNAVIRIEAPPDPSGSVPPAANAQLAQDRANSLKDALVGQGIDGSRIEAVSVADNGRADLLLVRR